MGDIYLKSNHLRRSKMTQVIQGKEQGGLTQVWVQLSQDHQAGVIQLMAQLVLKVVFGQTESSRKEVGDEQDPD